MINGLASGPVVMPHKISSSSPLDNDARLRDSLTALVGKGFTSFDSDEARGHAARLFSLLDIPTAQKLLSHISIYNQNPSNLHIPITQKISSFYDLGANDPAIDGLLHRIGKFGSGPIAGLNDSPDISNMDIRGQDFVKK